jgi:hypothetical protein
MALEWIERSFAWLGGYRRLNIIFERSKEHLIAFVAIAFISVLARRVNRPVTRCDGREQALICCSK